MYVCMYTYVCMYVCMHACMHACMYVHTMYAACMYACMYVCIYVCMHVCMYVECMHACIYIYYIPESPFQLLFYELEVLDTGVFLVWTAPRCSLGRVLKARAKGCTLEAVIPRRCRSFGSNTLWRFPLCVCVCVCVWCDADMLLRLPLCSVCSQRTPR